MPDGPLDSSRVVTEPPSYDMRLLPAFVAVAEELHFGRAARRLLLAQPALSRKIAGLEHQLGVVLLVRSSREVRLTPAGEVFLRAAREVLRHAARAEAAVRAGSAGLVVHLGDDVDPLVGAAVARFSAAEPELDVEVLVGHSSAVVPAVRSGVADVGFDIAEGVPAEFGHRVVSRQPVGLACALDHPRSGDVAMRWTDLAGERLFVAPERVHAGFNAFQRARLADTGVTCEAVPGPAIKGPLLVAHVAGGRAGFLCPRHVFQPWPDDVAWVPLIPTVHQEVYMLWDRYRPASAELRRFVSGIPAAAGAGQGSTSSRKPLAS